MGFDFVFVLIFATAFLIIGFVLLLIFVPKLRAKFMGNNIKATRYMTDEYENDLRNIATKGADINKEGIKITARAIKDGITNESIYCKYCGESIDDDSVFCKKCGKKQ